MRFITEFEVSKSIDLEKLSFLLPDKKSIRELGIGKKIGSAFGWEHLYDGNSATNKYTLEIEAFPMDKWIKFKAGINECIEQAKANNYPPMFALLSIGNLLKDLEYYEAKKEPL